jgi:AraC-like DNA-binding protein
LIEAVFAASTDEARQNVLESFLAEHAQAIRMTPWVRLRRLGTRISLQMASMALGVSQRQSQRIALREMGTNIQTLVKLWRAERSFIYAQQKLKAGIAVGFANHALDTDYADQSHFARECKAVTGRTPKQLFHDLQNEEADWFYRLEFPSHDNSTPSGSA